MQKYEHRANFVKSFPASIYYYLLAKFGVDTAENDLRANPNRVRVSRVKLRVIRI